MLHLVQLDHNERLTAAMAVHPSATSSAAARAAVAPAARRVLAADVVAPRGSVDDLAGVDHGEDGSLVTEYGLLAVVAATVAGVVIQWASGGALVTLFNALLRHARSLVGA